MKENENYAKQSCTIFVNSIGLNASFFAIHLFVSFPISNNVLEINRLDIRLIDLLKCIIAHVKHNSQIFSVLNYEIHNYKCIRKTINKS